MVQARGGAIGAGVAWGRGRGGGSRLRGGASVRRGGGRPASGLVGGQRCGERTARSADGHGCFSGPRWRRRGSCPLLHHVWHRLRLGTGDQNTLGGADAAALGFSGSAAPGPRVRGPRWRRPLFPGPAGRETTLSPSFSARRRREGIGLGARGGAAVPGRALRCPSPAGAWSGLTLRLRPSEAQPRDGRIPAPSPGSEPSWLPLLRLPSPPSASRPLGADRALQ